MGSFQSYGLGVDGVDGVIDAELTGLPIYNPDNSTSITPITQDNRDNPVHFGRSGRHLGSGNLFQFFKRISAEGRQIGLPNGWQETFKDYWS